MKNRHLVFLKDVKAESGTEDVFVSLELPWKAAGAVFGDMPRLAEKKPCTEEMKDMFPSAKSFEDFAGKVLTGGEFAQLLFRDQ